MAGVVRALTPDQHRRLMRAHQNGADTKALAVRFGVSERTVRRYLKREVENAGVSDKHE